MLIVVDIRSPFLGASAPATLTPFHAPQFVDQSQEILDGGQVGTVGDLQADVLTGQ